MLEDWLRYFADEWEFISQAPLTLVAALIVFVLFVLILRWFYTARIAALGKRVEVSEGQIGEVQHKLHAKSPDDALIKLGELTTRVEALSAGAWDPLTDDQIELLVAVFSELTQDSIYIRIINNGRTLARRLEQLFRDLGWSVYVRHDFGSQSGVTVLSRSPAALVIGDALQSVGLQVNFSGQPDDEIKINVGDKPAGWPNND